MMDGETDLFSQSLTVLLVKDSADINKRQLMYDLPKNSDEWVQGLPPLFEESSTPRKSIDVILVFIKA